MIDTTDYAVVRLFKGANRLRVQMPTTNMQYLKFYRGPIREYILFKDDNYCEINAKHRDWVIEQLRYLFEGVVEYRQYSTTGVCDTRCQDAEDPICVCKCKGEFHGGGGDWDYVIDTTLISSKVTEVTRYWPSLDWRLMASELPLWIEELNGPHPVHTLIAERIQPATEEVNA